VFFRERLTRLGHDVIVPDLEEGDFQGLTITRQLGVVRREIARSRGDLALIGSSMGGYLAVLAANQEPRIPRLMLMAPAIDMKARWTVRYGADQLARWKAQGVAPTCALDSGHELIDQLETIWTESAAFFGIDRAE